MRFPPTGVARANPSTASAGCGGGNERLSDHARTRPEASMAPTKALPNHGAEYPG